MSSALNIIIISWILSTIASVFAAKYACEQFDVDAVVLAMIQFFVASTILMGVSLFTNSPFRRPSQKHLIWLLVVSVGVFARETLKFAAVAHININLFNALKSLGPVVLVLLDGTIYRVWPARNTLVPFGTIVIGGLIMGAASFNSFTEMLSAAVVIGSTCTILSTLVECGATIGQKWVMRDAPDLDDVSVQYYLSSFSMVFSIISFLDESSHHGSQVPSVTVREGSPVLLLAFALIASSLLAFISTQLAIKSLRKISAAQYTILDTMRRLLSSVLAVFMFGENMNILSAFGLAMSLSGIYMYNRATRGNLPTEKLPKSASGFNPRPILYGNNSEPVKVVINQKEEKENQIQHQTNPTVFEGKWKKAGAIHQEEEDQIEREINFNNYISSEYTPLVSSRLRFPPKRSPNSVRISDIESVV